MRIERFEEIKAWQKARELTVEIYRIFRNSKDYGFSNQVCRARVSIMNNIAEGFERRTNKEFIHFLFIAKGSCGEVRSMLYLAKDLNCISEIQFNQLFQMTEESSRMLAGLIKYLQTADNK